MDAKLVARCAALRAEFLRNNPIPYRPLGEHTPADLSHWVRLAAQYWALCVEIAGRALDLPELTDQALVQSAVAVVMNPDAEALAAVFSGWQAKHPLLLDELIAGALTSLLITRLHFDAIILKLAGLRSRRPVGTAFIELDSPNAELADITKFFRTLDSGQRRRVKRGLVPDRGQAWHPRETAIEGAVGRYIHGTARLSETLLQRAFPLLPNPVLGMERRDPSRDGRDWNAISQGVARHFCAAALPYFAGLLEWALPEGARAAQAAEIERARALKRGGEVEEIEWTAQPNAYRRRHLGEYLDSGDEKLAGEMLDPATADPLVYKGAEELAASDELRTRIYRTLPSKPARYFDALMLTGSQRAAARTAKISEWTARRYEKRYGAALRHLLAMK